MPAIEREWKRQWKLTDSGVVPCQDSPPHSPVVVPPNLLQLRQAESATGWKQAGCSVFGHHVVNMCWNRSNSTLNLLWISFIAWCAAAGATLLSNVLINCLPQRALERIPVAHVPLFECVCVCLFAFTYEIRGVFRVPYEHFKNTRVNLADKSVWTS